MGKKLLTYSFGSIALYLVVYYASGAQGLLKTAGTEGIGTIKAFQGR